MHKNTCKYFLWQDNIKKMNSKGFPRLCRGQGSLFPAVADAGIWAATVRAIGG